MEGGRISGMQVVHTDFEGQHHDVMPKGTLRPADPFDYLVLAVPPGPLGELAGIGEPGHRIVDRLPQIAEARRLHSEPIAVLDLYFKRKLKGIPRENVVMGDSDIDLSIIDISQLWADEDMQDVTVLTLGASDYWALPSEHRGGERLLDDPQAQRIPARLQPRQPTGAIRIRGATSTGSDRTTSRTRTT